MIIFATQLIFDGIFAAEFALCDLASINLNLLSSKL
jgi:hypothetical protein